MQLMRSTRATTTALVLALGLGAAASARADGELQVRGVYYKERATRVQQPMLDGRFDVGDHGTLQGHLLVDAISSASAVASGGAAFDERRVEGGLGYSHVFGKLTLGATARYSTEPDYRSTFATVRGQAELFQRNLTLGLTVGAGHDQVSNAGASDLVERVRGTLDTGLVSASVSQIFGENTVGAITYDLILLDGFQQNPYRRVPFDNGAFNEVHPDSRVRQAAALSLRRFVPRTETTVIATYRFYRDDWGIVAHTPELRFAQAAGDNVVFGGGYRFHVQTAADFWRERYNGLDPVSQPLRTADGKLADITTHTMTAKLAVMGATFGWEDRWADVRMEFILEYYLQDDRYFGNAGIAHAAVTIPFTY
jgi:hypothetical protein